MSNIDLLKSKIYYKQKVKAYAKIIKYLEQIELSNLLFSIQYNNDELLDNFHLNVINKINSKFIDISHCQLFIDSDLWLKIINSKNDTINILNEVKAQSTLSIHNYISISFGVMMNMKDTPINVTKNYIVDIFKAENIIIND